MTQDQKTQHTPTEADLSAAIERLGQTGLEWKARAERAEALLGEALKALEQTAFALEAVNVQLESWGKQSALNVPVFLAQARAVILKTSGGE